MNFFFVAKFSFSTTFNLKFKKKGLWISINQLMTLFFVSFKLLFIVKSLNCQPHPPALHHIKFIFSFFFSFKKNSKMYFNSYQFADFHNFFFVAVSHFRAKSLINWRKLKQTFYHEKKNKQVQQNSWRQFNLQKKNQCGRGYFVL